MTDYVKRVFEHFKGKYNFLVNFETPDCTCYYKSKKIKTGDMFGVSVKTITGLFFILDKNTGGFQFIDGTIELHDEEVICQEDIIEKIEADCNGEKVFYYYLNSKTAYLEKKEINLNNYLFLTDKDLAPLLLYSDETKRWITEIPYERYHIKDFESFKNIKTKREFCEFYVQKPVSTKLAHCMTPNDLDFLFDVTPENYISKVSQYIYNTKQYSMPDSMVWFLANNANIKNSDNNCVFYLSIINDYIGMCRRTQQKVNCNMGSIKRIEDEHNKLTLQIKLENISKIKVRKEMILKETKFDGISFELIDSKEKLYNEAITMHNCVLSYDYKINTGKSSIYHVKIKGREYTLEVRKDLNGKLYAHQMTGAFNSKPNDEVLEKVKEIVKAL